MKNTIIKDVAEIISETPCRDGVANHIIAQAGNSYGIAGTTRLRDLARMFRCIDGNGTFPYFYSHNRYFPTRDFKDFCRGYVRKYS